MAVTASRASSAGRAQAGSLTPPRMRPRSRSAADGVRRAVRAPALGEGGHHAHLLGRKVLGAGRVRRGRAGSPRAGLARRAGSERRGGRRPADRQCGREDRDAGVGVVDPVDGHLVDPKPWRWARTSSSVSKNQRSSSRVAAGRSHVGADRLEAALGVGEACMQHAVSRQVVRAGDELALEARDAHGRCAAAAIRSRPRCARRAAERPAGAALAGRSRGRRPCRHDAGVAADQAAAGLVRGPSRSRRTTFRFGRSAASAAISGVASTLALSEIVMIQE